MADGVRRQLSGDGAGRCLSWRAGGDAARSASSSGDHQVQPGAYLDGGKLGGDRRGPICASTVWKDPGATSLLAERCRCGIAITRSPTSPVNPGCCASSTSCVSTRFLPRNCNRSAAIFPLGRYPLRIEHSTLRLAEYQQFLQQEAVSIDAFRQHQQRAFNDERERWIASGQAHFDSQEVPADAGVEAPLQRGQQGVESPISGNLWQVRPPRGVMCAPATVLVVLEINENGDPAVGRRATAWCNR